jgi:serine-type D-Ala-D-Ala carboxypeptidase (penicillin-binding protein 5/6)
MNEPQFLANRFEVKVFSALGAALIILLTLSFILGSRVHRGDISAPSKAVIHPFDGIVLGARSVHVYDIRTGKVLFEKNSHERIPLASLTKVMTAVVALENAPQWSVVTINKSAVETDGDSGLKVGERWSLKDLLDFSLVSSSNDGVQAVAYALGALSKANPEDHVAEGDFVNRMNSKADELGMKNTYYFNVTGLDMRARTEDSAGQGGAYGTAEDMSKLFAYILREHPELFEATKKSTIAVTSFDTLHTARNTDIIVDSIPGILASKTGTTDLAGGNLVIAFDPEVGRPIVISLLGSTEEGRFIDMLTLVEKSIEALRNE